MNRFSEISVICTEYLIYCYLITYTELCKIYNISLNIIFHLQYTSVHKNTLIFFTNLKLNNISVTNKFITKIKRYILLYHNSEFT